MGLKIIFALCYFQVLGLIQTGYIKQTARYF